MNVLDLGDGMKAIVRVKFEGQQHPSVGDKVVSSVKEVPMRLKRLFLYRTNEGKLYYATSPTSANFSGIR